MERKFIKKRLSDRKPFKKDGDNNGFGGGRGEGSGARRGPRPPRMSIPKGTEINYKNIAFLQKCLTERGKLFSRRLTSASATQQRQISIAVKLARFLGLLPVGSSKRK
jgi:small subunit ribosomal protein S18